MATLTDRMIGAAKLDVKTYEDVEHDESAMGQAMAVVALSAVAAAIGSAGLGGMRGIIGALFAALIGWFVWAGIIYLVGTQALPDPQTKADLGQVLRTVGFAASPGVLSIFAIVPVLGWLVRLAVFVWQIAATIVAVRQALDYTSTAKAAVVCILGVIAYTAVFMFLGALGLAGMGMRGMM